MYVELLQHVTDHSWESSILDTFIRDLQHSIRCALLYTYTRGHVCTINVTIHHGTDSLPV